MSDTIIIEIKNGNDLIILEKMDSDDIVVNIFFFRSCPTCNMDRGRIYNCRWHLSIVPKNITDKGIRNIWCPKKSIGSGLV